MRKFVLFFSYCLDRTIQLLISYDSFNFFNSTERKICKNPNILYQNCNKRLRTADIVLLNDVRTKLYMSKNVNIESTPPAAKNFRELSLKVHFYK